MHGASGESLAVLTEALTATVDGAVNAGTDANRVAEDLLGVAEILRREPSLRRVATDVSISSAGKAELMRKVFGDRLHASSLELVSQAAGRRWVASRDLAAALERLGLIAVIKAADKAGQADALEDELFGFGQLVHTNTELRDALSDPARSVADKRTLLRSLLEGRVTSATLRLAEQSVVGTHRTVPLAIEEYQNIAAQHRNRLVATVHVARDLDDQDKQRLARALSGQYDRPVHLNVVVDPSVIGGVKVEIGDDVIDGTVISRLQEAGRRLAG